MNVPSSRLPLDGAAASQTLLAMLDAPVLRDELVRRFADGRFRLLEAASGAQAQAQLEAASVGVLVLDVDLLEPSSRLAELQRLATLQPWTKTIVLSERPTVALALEALRLGAFDLVEQPVVAEVLVERVHAAFEELDQSLEREAMVSSYATLFETIPGIVWFMTVNGQFTRINESGASALGYRPSTLLGQSYEVVLAEELPENAPERWAFKERRTGARATRSRVVALKTATGEQRHFEVYSSGVYVDGRQGDRSLQQRCGTVGMAFDVTEQRKLQERLQQRRRLEAIGGMAGGMAHEMNNVLAVVLGLGSVLESELEADEEVMEDLHEIVVAARRGKSLVQSLLGYAGRTVRRTKAVMLNDAVVQVQRILRRTMPKNITLAVELDPMTTRVDCDEDQVNQVLLNLCLNGIRAMPRGGTLTIATSYLLVGPGDVPDHPDLVPGVYARLQVSDEGEGISPENLSRVFEPFFTTRPVGEGTGLGLSMAYGIVRGHDGVVTIDSTPDRGTTVTVLLPSRLPERAPLDPEGPASSQRRPSGPATVLIVDDEPMIRSMAQRLFESLGCRVLVAEGGREALELYRQHAGVDLVLLDLAMPGMDGGECFDELERLDPDARVIICSGLTSGRNVEEVLRRGAQAALAKPFDVAQLADTVARVLVGE